MKCPKCGYVRQPGDRAPDYECPSCGVVYQKYLEAVRQQRAEAQARAAESVPAAPAAPEPARAASVSSRLGQCEDCGGKVSRLALACVHCGRPFGADAGEDVSSVSVVDVRMDFMSMVVFMVKWAIAVIPAAIILMFVGMLLAALFAGAAFNP